MTTDKKTQPEQAKVRLNLLMPPGRPSVISQHLFAQNFGEFVQLSFFEVIVPFVDAENSEQIEQMQAAGVNAECVARINVPASRMKEFVRVMKSMIPSEPETKVRGKRNA